MRSVILCEGKDDLWFIAYFLHKTAGWIVDKNIKRSWQYYKIPVNDHRQEVQYITNHCGDHAAIKAVGGQDRLRAELENLLYIDRVQPKNAIETIVMVKYCDLRDHRVLVDEISTWFDGSVTLENHQIGTYTMTVNGEPLTLRVLPVVIPFDSTGAIETVLLHSLSEAGIEEAYIAESAHNYVQQLANSPNLTKYLAHGRQITKAEYSAAIAITNPDHSTELFRGMVMACPWESTESVRNHYSCIARAITSNNAF